MGIALQTARAHNVPVPVTAVVAQLVNRMMAAGQGEADYSALATVLFDLAGVQWKRK
jgi:3-hydroxyisobutyrate dehydrogenase-like beta-hydroxyacid dehydrogenase